MDNQDDFDEIDDLDELDPPLQCNYARASGFSFEDCHAIAVRFEEKIGFKPPEGQSFVEWHGADRSGWRHKLDRGWHTDLWRSPSGRIFVADIAGRIHHHPGNEHLDEPWSAHSVPVTPTGIWGLDDDHVYAWGYGPDQTPMVAFWDGKAWSTLPDPPEVVVRLHGLRPDLLFAVGGGGFIAWFDGMWHRITTETDSPLGAVWVVSENEVYVGGADGKLLQASAYGATEVLQAESHISAIAKWNDQIWVATLGDQGLCTLSGNELVPMKPALRALCLDARAELLMATMDAVISTADGAAYRGRPIDSFAQQVNLEPYPYASF